MYSYIVEVAFQESSMLKLEYVLTIITRNEAHSNLTLRVTSWLLPSILARFRSGLSASSWFSRTSKAIPKTPYITQLVNSKNTHFIYLPNHIIQINKKKISNRIIYQTIRKYSIKDRQLTNRLIKCEGIKTENCSK